LYEYERRSACPTVDVAKLDESSLEASYRLDASRIEILNHCDSWWTSSLDTLTAPLQIFGELVASLIMLF
jgi:hypothetical protein